jgi:thiamine biosynthesis protein ThiS
VAIPEFNSVFRQSLDYTFISMKLTINGEAKEIAVGSVAELVAHLGMKADRVAIELNREIVPRDRWASTSLRDGDKLEIVHFVGGGTNEL